MCAEFRRGIKRPLIAVKNCAPHGSEEREIETKQYTYQVNGSK